MSLQYSITKVFDFSAAEIPAPNTPCLTRIPVNHNTADPIHRHRQSPSTSRAFHARSASSMSARWAPRRTAGNRRRATEVHTSWRVIVILMVSEHLRYSKFSVNTIRIGVRLNMLENVI